MGIRHSVLIVLFCMIIGQGDAVPLQLGKAGTNLLDSITDILKSNCQRIIGNCKEQKSDAAQKKQALKEFLVKHGKTVAEVDKSFAKTLDAKLTLINLKGLIGVVLPANDGIWAGDQILSEKQALSLIETLKAPAALFLDNAKKIVDQIGLIRVKRGPMISLEQYRGYKWSMPVPYYIDPNGFSADDISQIKQALYRIQYYSCVRFTPLQTRPRGGNYISYGKLGGAWGCGHSYVGMQSNGNPIALSTDGVCKKLFYGTVIHETLHALGLLHEHARYDRDKYITVHWNNIDPRYYDIFAMYNPNYYTPYGVQYNVMSILHYPAYITNGAVDSKKPVLSTRDNPTYYNPKIGWMDTLTYNDLDLVRHAYCKSSNCLDANVGCGWHAANGLCPNNRGMIDKCPRSCNVCS